MTFWDLVDKYPAGFALLYFFTLLFVVFVVAGAFIEKTKRTIAESAAVTAVSASESAAEIAKAQAFAATHQHG